MEKLQIILEYIWLALAALCVGLGIHASVKHGFNVGYIFFVLAALAAVMYGFKRYRRLHSKR